MVNFINVLFPSPKIYVYNLGTWCGLPEKSMNNVDDYQ